MCSKRSSTDDSDSERTYEKRTASLAVDGNLTTRSCTGGSTTPWWSVDLGTPTDVGRVCITNEHDTYNGQEHLYNRCLTAFNPTPWMLWTGGERAWKMSPNFQKMTRPHYFSESNHLHYFPVSQNHFCTVALCLWLSVSEIPVNAHVFMCTDTTFW